MATMAENVIAAGSKTHPLMLEKGMYDSWKTQILLYIRGKENGEMLINSIENGPYQILPEITIKADDGVTDIKLDIYTLINHYQTTKEIWDRVKELIKGTEMTKQECASMLYDEFDKFTSEPEESIHSYYLRFAKLINDMNMIPMSMPNMQINTKFVNHLQPEWSRFVTAAKQARDLYVVNFDQFSAYSSRFSPMNNQLRTSSNPRTQATIQNDQVLVQNVQGRQFQRYAGNAERVKLHEQGGEGHIGKQCTAKKRVKDAERLEENDDGDDLQLYTTSNFKADHVDAYDSDCDDQATINAIFMASLSSIGPLNDDIVTLTYDSNTLSEVTHYDTYHDDDMLNSDVQKTKYNEHFVSHDDSYVELTSNSNVISYTEYMVTI
ncbi:hypothetical protein Tco_0294180 [Tanacetum coccineum]